MTKDEYFIVLDEAVICSHGRLTEPKYDLMFGDPATAIGTYQASSSLLAVLLAKVPHEHEVYYTYLPRTEGKTGVRLFARTREAL